MSLKIGNQLTVTITDLSRGGAGVARANGGQTVFVPCSLTGDEVKVEIVEVKRRHAFAKIIEITKPSPDRVSPQCDVFTRCGGCQWQHVPYAIQWSTKTDGVRQALSATSNDKKVKFQEFSADTIWHYRNRVQMRGKGDALGFYAERSHDIVPVTQCAIASPEINQALVEIRSKDCVSNKEYKVEIEVTEDGSVQCHWNTHHAASGFRQVNDEQNKKLIAWIRQTFKKNHPIYDLYGGSANLSRELASQGVEVHCVDQSTPENKRGQQPDTLHFHNQDVLSWLKNRITDLMYKRIPEPTSPWSAIIDPPRGGMGDDFEDIVSRLDKLNVKSMILVGCKTDTWVRDIIKLQQRKWTLASVAVFDFFPHTPHIETAAYLENQTHD